MIFRNRIASFGWGFAAVFLSFVGAMTYVFIRDGAPAGWSPLLILVILAGFWVAGLGLASYVANQPCVYVAILRGGEVEVTWCYPLRKRSRRWSLRELEPCVVVETTDDEGSPYFHSRFAFPDGELVDLAEGHDRASCEAARDRFNRVLRGE
jgi:hypothetical protein